MKKCLRSWWIIILIQIVTGNLYAQKTFQIYKTETPPLIDGFVNDETWDHLSSIDTFLQREPMLGEPLSENTEVFVCFDSQFLYFGIKCYQPEETVFAKQMKFDESYYTDDRFAIILDTYSDHRTAYFIGINALGGREDAIIQGNSMNSSWNGLWKGKAQITSEGWEAEIALPFRSLSFDKKSDSWGLVMNRFITKKREWGSWPVANINASQFSIAETGMLKGLTGITHGVGIDFSPYFITGFDAKNGEKPEMKLNAGADLYYQIAPNLKAALSINTDFAET
ncbi:MAG: carbohydrate binding family 9 domain-containing protein [Bacteroidales bacterium]|jgi:hypothetical protein|nr:carbohydrate binding family 9 domain-containing protein [Bacteroidales bacterium]